MGKKVVQIILSLIFIIFVACAIIVGSYIFNQPGHDGDSRIIISGPWYDKANDVTFEFGDDSKFKMSKTKSGDVIADGYFRIDENGKKIKLFILPKHSTDEFKDALNLKLFAQISYTSLVDTTDKDVKRNTELDDPADATFMLKGTNDVYNCEMPVNTLELYGNKEFKAKK